MRFSQSMFVLVLCSVAFATVLMFFSGCGLVADKDRIKIAKIEDEYVTRGDVAKYIREMPPEQRPVVQTKGDLLRILQNYVDQRIKNELIEEYRDKIEPMLPRELAEQQYYQQHPEEQATIHNPKEYSVSHEMLKAMRESIEASIDHLYMHLLGEAALQYASIDAYRSGALPISEEQFQKEYDAQVSQGSLVNFEEVAIEGLCFPVDDPNASSEAARIREKLVAGESVETLAAPYIAQGKAYLLTTRLQNNPEQKKFLGFWQQASGSKEGDIIGPVYIPESESVQRDAEGKPQVKRLPESYLVCRIVNALPERDKTLEEARMILAPQILYTQMLERLRNEKGVEIYEDKVPEPEFSMQGPMG
jgi:hypothetical protein